MDLRSINNIESRKENFPQVIKKPKGKDHC